MKAKTNRAKIAKKNGSVYTVNVARMEQYLSRTRGDFNNRIERTRATQSEFIGVLAGTVARSAK